MTVYLLDQRIAFPDPQKTDSCGVLAVGGDLNPKRLLAAYSLGVFPWFAEGDPILWHCPKERAVLKPEELHVSKTTRKVMRQRRFEVRFDTAFNRVIRACAETPRPGQDGTWITEDMIAAYTKLHLLNFAHCAEAWQDNILAGGIYGVTLGRVFFGESMFSHRTNSSKVAFVTMVEQIAKLGYRLIDAQVYNPFLGTLGVCEISRGQFLQMLPDLLSQRPDRVWP